MWVLSLLHADKFTTEMGNNRAILWATLLLTLLNSLLCVYAFYKSKETNLPSPFVGATYWFAMSAIPAFHTYWQAQLVLLGLLLGTIALLNMDYLHEATEEAFLATLICCIVAVVPMVLYVGVFLIWVYLLFKGQMTWRVWLATLIAIIIRVVSMTIFHYAGVLEFLWMENIPRLAGLQWAFFGALMLLTALLIFLPIRRPSTASGIFYVVSLLLLTIAGGVFILI